MSPNNIVDRIQGILERHETIPQAVKDEIIMLGLLEIMKILDDHTTRLVFLEKYKPWLQAISWAAVLVAGSLITMALTGRFQLIVHP